MIIVPFDFGVKSPVVETVAMPDDVDQVTALLVALAGCTSNVSCWVCPSVLLVPPMVTLVASTTGPVTPVMVMVACFEIPEPSFAVAVTVTLPFFKGVSIPV